MAAVLMEELVEEILLRFPPEDPASLVRTALVCKGWRRLITDKAFHGRFREFHRTPPMLGFLCHRLRNHGANEAFAAHFIPTSSFPPRGHHGGWQAIDSRHGRVLLYGVHGASMHRMLVWDPVTDEQMKLPQLPSYLCPGSYIGSWNAAVLCATDSGCDHLDCHRGPFLVVFMRSMAQGTFALLYSSEVGAWSELTSAKDIHCGGLALRRSALVRNALYFPSLIGFRILKYNLTTGQISKIRMPTYINSWHGVLMTTENGMLGLAGVQDTRLYLLSRKPNCKDSGWIQNRVIELKTLLPIDTLSVSSHVAGFADGAGIIFLRMKDRLFIIDLKSGKVKDVEDYGSIYDIVPYVSFYTPVFR
ncbi:hypothetical protein ACP70R_015164 [Stipagrostis hirtigluma subsp. patula]